MPPEPTRLRSLSLVRRRELRVPGFRAAGVHCGLKESELDLALLVSDVPAHVAGVFTRSTVPGAPVTVSRERVAKGSARGVVVNSGVANVGLGEPGVETARRMTELAADAVGCGEAEMLVASTGVIGDPIPLAKVRTGIQRAKRALSAEGLADAARAIMTTDTVRKIATRRVKLKGAEITLTGIAKGSGMVQPNMATMLAFVLTDADVSPRFLQRCLREASDASFNRVTVDGETSTSDMALLFANGVAGNTPLRGARSPGAAGFQRGLTELCVDLAQALARDGEGATRLIHVHVSGARSNVEAERAARHIANSPLVKTAVFGGDPNWGRILQAVGASEVRIRLDRCTVSLGGAAVYRAGAAQPGARRKAAKALKKAEVEIGVNLGAGKADATVWTCDLSYEYVRINAEYTT